MRRQKIFAPIMSMMLLIAAVTPPLAGGEGDDGDSDSSMAMALPVTYTLTLTLEEDGETFDFSMTVASRHFVMNLGEKDISLRGRLWQGPNGGELLDFRLEYSQWVDGSGAGRQRRGSTWNGSAHLPDGKPVEIVTFLSGSFTVRLDVQH